MKDTAKACFCYGLLIGVFLLIMFVIFVENGGCAK